MVFDSTKFKLKYVLGSGSFGVVTFAEYTDVTTKKITYYALKSLSKATVIETGKQLNLSLFTALSGQARFLCFSLFCLCG